MFPIRSLKNQFRNSPSNGEPTPSLFHCHFGSRHCELAGLGVYIVFPLCHTYTKEYLTIFQFGVSQDRGSIAYAPMGSYTLNTEVGRDIDVLVASNILYPRTYVVDSTVGGIEYLEDHYNDTDFSIARLAEQISMSEGYISRLFKSETDTGINNYLIRYRIRKAMDFLKDP